MQQQLIACPFCGLTTELDVEEDVGVVHDVVFLVFCSSCGASGPPSYISGDAAIEFWNTRNMSRSAPIPNYQLN